LIKYSDRIFFGCAKVQKFSVNEHTPALQTNSSKMIILKTAGDLVAALNGLKAEGFSIHFVPTMGALHKGHISLLKHAKSPSSIVVTSIFVNPTQFNNPSDFEKYPNTIKDDIYKLEKSGTHILFLPSILEIYPNGMFRPQNYNLGYLENILEGAFRPGHFQGVCQVVDRLLQIVKPSTLFVGQKDYQQCMVLEKLVSDSGMPVKIVMGKTLRETDGLAMSSRNMRFSPIERKKAPGVYQTLLNMKEQMHTGDLMSIKNKAFNDLLSKGFVPDYTEIADATSLLPVTDWDGESKMIILAAAFLNEVRLIDNILL